MGEIEEKLKPTLRVLLIQDYHKIVGLRASGYSWNQIGKLYGRRAPIMNRGWASLQAAIKSGKIPDPASRTNLSAAYEIVSQPARSKAAPAPIAKSDNLLRDLVLAKMAESESAPNGKPMYIGHSLDPADYDDDDMSGPALRARKHARDNQP